MCISPIRIRHPTIKGEFLDVPCGKCLECANKKVNDWSFRLKQEMKDKNAYFFTLTYDDENLPWKFEFDPVERSEDNNLIPCFSKSDIQQFIHSLRDDLRRSGYDGKIKYFISSEYGGSTLRPHYHGIIFGYPYLLDKFTANIEKYWHRGFVSASICNDVRIYYTLKYAFKNAVVRPPGLSPNSDRCFIMCSKKLGINFLTSQMENYMRQYNITVHLDGYERTIPKYYRDKVFVTQEQKDKVKELFWDLFDEFAKCPDSANRFRWRDECYKKKLDKAKQKLKKEKM